jgi:hypothetical protein
MVPPYRLGGTPPPALCQGAVVGGSRILRTVRHLGNAPRMGVTVPLADSAQWLTQASISLRRFSNKSPRL